MSAPLWKPAPQRIAQANITRFMKKHGLHSYEELIQWSTVDVACFWEACLDDLGLAWQTPYSQVMDDSKGLAWVRWFVDGQINIVHNAIDRHLKTRADQTALIWEPDEGEAETYSYQELHDNIATCAAGLQRLGVDVGDHVALYMPMIPEMVVAFYACLKIGAVVIPVFSGFGAGALAVRMNDANVKVLFTADGGFRRGKKIPIKNAADEALKDCPCVEKVVVACRTEEAIPWDDERDLEWDEFMQVDAPATTEILDAEATAMILYTSGTTGKPKGCVHTHGGSLAQIVKELTYNFDVKADARFFWVTDIGWMMGPWELIGVHSNGGAVTIFEGAPNYPRPDRLWEIVEEHQITHLGISPTAVRLIKSFGDEWVKKHDLSSLQVLGSTGEAWDPESYEWFFNKVGEKRCPIINISGGTELVGCLLAPLPIHPLKSCSLQGPSLGMDVDIFDEEGNSIRDSGEVGYLVCKQPAPSMTKGFLNDPDRYIDAYFSKWPHVWNHGDWATMDEDGHWYLRGRADDTIKIAGRRTGPAEIESVLVDHPAVIESAVIGVPHDVKGNELVCFVVLQNGQEAGDILLSELKEKVVTAMGKALTPREIHAVAMLPKTRSAKIVRGIIRKKFLGEDLGDTASVENPAAIEAIPMSKSCG